MVGGFPCLRETQDIAGLQLTEPAPQALQALLFLFEFRERELFPGYFLGDLLLELAAIRHELGPLLQPGRFVGTPEGVRALVSRCGVHQCPGAPALGDKLLGPGQSVVEGRMDRQDPRSRGQRNGANPAEFTPNSYPMPGRLRRNLDEDQQPTFINHNSKCSSCYIGAVNVSETAGSAHLAAVQRWPLYAAGFTTAFGAHAVAAGLGAESADIGLSLLGLGILLALYDIAEVFLKPVFGALSDRIGPKPVIVGGLVAFSVASLIGLWADQSAMLAAARLGQGMAASAFSPASSAGVARLAGGKTGHYFGRYGSWKGLGYAIGPLLGALAIMAGGFALLFLILSALGLVVAAWAAYAVPSLAPLPRPRYTIVDVWRQSTERSFLGPTLVLAAATGALGAAVGFLPALAAREGLGTAGSVAVVTVLAVASSLIQPRIGGLRDRGLLADKPGMVAGLVAIALGTLMAGLLPGAGWTYCAAILIGLGIGIATPLAFAHLADSTPPERLGRTLGSAELGRELGDAGGPLLVGGVAVAAGLPWGLGALALAVGAAAFAAPATPAASPAKNGGASAPPASR